MRFVYLYFKFLFIFYFYTNTNFPSARFVESLTLRKSSLGNIGQEASSQRKRMRNISGGG